MASFNPLDEFKKEQTRKKFAGGKNYFLFVGAMNPRKNIPALVKAFDDFKKETKSDFKLLLAGPHFYGVSEVYNTLDNCEFKKDIIFTGRLTEDDLAHVMASAFALTFVPYFEGFGIPLVEAMQCQIPIITSNVTSLPEIADNAALFVNPYDTNDIKNAMVKLLGSEELRQQLITNGIQRKNNFSWDKSANLLWESVEKCLK